MDFPITGVILASGLGSRMLPITRQYQRPKHLLPLGNSIVLGPTLKKFKELCSQVLIVIPPQTKPIYEKVLSENIDSLENIHFREKLNSGFTGDFQVIKEFVREGAALITVGDLIFQENEIERFLICAQKKTRQISLAFDKKHLKSWHYPTILDFRMALAFLPQEELKNTITLNPESVQSMFFYLLKKVFQKKIALHTIEVLYNINTPQLYNEAQKYIFNK